MIAAVLVAAVASSLGLFAPAEFLAAHFGTDAAAREMGFLVWGVALGYALGVINRVPWLELPRRAIEWYRARRYVFGWMACGMACGAFLVLY